MYNHDTLINFMRMQNEMFKGVTFRYPFVVAVGNVSLLSLLSVLLVLCRHFWLRHNSVGNSDGNISDVGNSDGRK